MDSRADFTQPLAARGLRPLAQLAENRPHGDRLRYMGGCRCQLCRGANTAYERQRAAARRLGHWNGFVSAAQARDHLIALSRTGVGRHTVCDVSGISGSTLTSITNGTRKHIRANTAKAILAVSAQARADHALIPAEATWRLIHELLADGYTKAELAIALGRKRPALQLNKNQVTVRNAYEMEQLYGRLRKVDATASWRLIDLLKDEGYRMGQIEKCIGELARVRGIDFDGLDVSATRVRAQVAKLIELVYRQLTE